MADPTATLRLDKWLWFARFCKSRALGQDWIETGKVAINGQVVHKASSLVRLGDWIDLDVGRQGRAVRVKALGERRGPAPEAQALYDDHGESAFFIALNSLAENHDGDGVVPPSGLC